MATSNGRSPYATPVSRKAELTENTVIIRRLGCRDEASKRIYRAALLVSIDNTGFCNLSGVTDLEFSDNLCLLRLIADARNVGDNATIEEFLYFIEMKKLTVIIDDEVYPWPKIKEIITDYNKEPLTGKDNGKVEELPDIVDEPVLGDHSRDKEYIGQEGEEDANHSN